MAQEMGAGQSFTVLRFHWPGTGERTTFGYSMKYKRSGKVKGSLLLVRHRSDGTHYRVKSNALEGLALGPADAPFGYASFSGKATYRAWDWEEAEGNHTFVVYVEDRGEPGSNDAFWIEMLDRDDAVVGAVSMDEPASDNAVALQRGNIVVPHTASGK